MNLTWDKTLQVKPSVCSGQCSCEDCCILHNAGTDFPNQLVLSMAYSFWEPNLGYCHTTHFPERRTLSEKQVPLSQQKLAPQIKTPEAIGHTWLVVSTTTIFTSFKGGVDMYWFLAPDNFINPTLFWNGQKRLLILSSFAYLKSVRPWVFS